MDDRFKQLAKKFPPEAYKDVKIGRGFTTIDAYHIIERLTEVFGLCGTGWGCEVNDWIVTGNNVCAIGHIWYMDGTECREVPAVGDAQIIKENVAEAYKKAQTNLISKGASFIGVGLSVYQGKGVDDPYLDRAHEAGTEIVPHSDMHEGNRVASDDDWAAIKLAYEDHGVTRDQVLELLKSEPFCVGSKPRNLLAVHVPTVLDRITVLGEQAR